MNSGSNLVNSSRQLLESTRENVRISYQPGRIVRCSQSEQVVHEEERDEEMKATIDQIPTGAHQDRRSSKHGLAEIESNHIKYPLASGGRPALKSK